MSTMRDPRSIGHGSSAIIVGLLLAAHCTWSTARAQQDPMYSQYMFNTLAFNPAYAGSADVFTMMALRV
jgi:hypothetical protein